MTTAGKPNLLASAAFRELASWLIGSIAASACNVTLAALISVPVQRNHDDNIGPADGAKDNAMSTRSSP